MTSQKVLRLVIAALTFLLFNPANAQPFLENRAGISNDPDVSIASRALPTSEALDTFCESFVAQCYKIALEGQAGEVKITHSCQKLGGSRSPFFSYSCARGEWHHQENLTAKVLKAMGWAYHSPATTTTIEDVRVVTEETLDLSTATHTISKATTTTDATVTSTLRTLIVDVDTSTVPSTTVLSTTVIPYTVSATTTSTLTEVSTTTSTEASVTTEVFIGNRLIPPTRRDIVEVELEARSPSTFCLAFKIACENECSMDSSRRQIWLCLGGKATRYTYTLACRCRNGKKKTEHALEALAEDRKVASVTIKSTSTTWLTSSRTTTISAEVFTTEHATLTDFVSSTATTSTTTTATIGATTTYTGVSSPIVTEVATIPTTTTSTTTTTTQVVTTSRIVLAATGYVRGFDTTSGDDIGAVGRQRSSIDVRLLSSTASDEVYEEFMAVRDPELAVYQLARVTQPTFSLKQWSNNSDPVFRSGTPYYSELRIGPSSTCGNRATTAGPPEGDGNELCETFIFWPRSLDGTPGYTPDTVNMRSLWYNPEDSNPAAVTGPWAYWNLNRINTIADKKVFTARYPTYNPTYFTLRFPFALPR